MQHPRSHHYYKNGMMLRVDGTGRHLGIMRGGTLDPFQSVEALQGFTPDQISSAYNAQPKSLQGLFDAKVNSVANAYKGNGLPKKKKKSLAERLLSQ